MPSTYFATDRWGETEARRKGKAKLLHERTSNDIERGTQLTLDKWKYSAQLTPKKLEF